MEDFFGLVVFIIFLVISVGGRLARQGSRGAGGRPGPPRRERPNWPGPVAGPGLPGYPKPDWPQAPDQTADRPAPVRAASPPPAPAPARTPAQSGTLTSANPTWGSMGGTSMEGVSVEGAGMAPTTSEEATRFAAQSERFRTTKIVGLELTPSQEATVTQTDQALGLRVNTGQLVQSVVMAEVLGRPLALRRAGALFPYRAR